MALAIPSYSTPEELRELEAAQAEKLGITNIATAPTWEQLAARGEQLGVNIEDYKNNYQPSAATIQSWDPAVQQWYWNIRTREATDYRLWGQPLPSSYPAPRTPGIAGGTEAYATEYTEPAPPGEGPMPVYTPPPTDGGTTPTTPTPTTPTPPPYTGSYPLPTGSDTPYGSTPRAPTYAWWEGWDAWGEYPEGQPEVPLLTGNPAPSGDYSLTGNPEIDAYYRWLLSPEAAGQFGYDPADYGYDPFLIDQNVIANAGYEATGYDPTMAGVTPDMLVQNQLAQITSQDSPYMQQARAAGLQEMNKRGLLSSSMAVGASQAAAIERGLPIAQQDAETYWQTGIFNAEQSNAASQYLAEATNRAREYTAQAQAAFHEINSNAINESRQYGAEARNMLERMKFESAEKMRSQFADIGAKSREQLISIMWEEDKQFRDIKRDILVNAAHDVAGINAQYLEAIPGILQADMELHAKEKQIRALFDTMVDGLTNVYVAYGFTPDQAYALANNDATFQSEFQFAMSDVPQRTPPVENQTPAESGQWEGANLNANDKVGTWNVNLTAQENRALYNDFPPLSQFNENVRDILDRWRGYEAYSASAENPISFGIQAESSSFTYDGAIQYYREFLANGGVVPDNGPYLAPTADLNALVAAEYVPYNYILGSTR